MASWHIRDCLKNVGHKLAHPTTCLAASESQGQMPQTCWVVE